MADFVAILKKALDKHGDETPEKRTRIYGSVRTMLAKKLAEYSPPLAPEAITTQKRSLEDAIVSVERDYAKSVPETDPLAELEILEEAAGVGLGLGHGGELGLAGLNVRSGAGSRPAPTKDRAPVIPGRSAGSNPESTTG